MGFSETGAGKHVPRTVFVDLEPTVIDEMRLQKVFSVLKGAADGGLHIPHSTKKFPGYKPGSGEEKGEYDADFHKQRIFGGHVAEHMESLKEEDEQEYEKVYSSYIAEGKDCDDLEDLYAEVHKAIREDPVHEKKEGGDKPTRDGNEVSSNGKTWTRMVRLTFQERKERVAARIAKAQEKMLRRIRCIGRNARNRFFVGEGILSFDR